LISSDADGAIHRAGRFRVENGSLDEASDYTPGTWRRTDVHLENPEYHTRWYFKYFLGKGGEAETEPLSWPSTHADYHLLKCPTPHIKLAIRETVAMQVVQQKIKVCVS
ncbi:GTPase-activating Rap/Ran-GAP domain-like protein 3, partial [Ataeniobius toweri]|nr:GTPase-activating Rap/Ran-GAP domain-like protein 3 [Ataeniobius toweri]